MSRNRNRGRKNQGRAAQRRQQAGHALPATRPGVEGKKSIAKALGPNAQKAVKKANQLAKAGDHMGAAKIYRKLGDHLKGEAKGGLASRAYLRCARSLHKAGNEAQANEMVSEAIAQAKASNNPRQALTHFRDLVRRLRKNGNDEMAERIKGEIQEGMGVQNVDKKRRRRGQRQN